MTARGDRCGDRWGTHVVLLTVIALIAALSLAQPAFAEDPAEGQTADATTTAAEPAASTEPASTEPAPAAEPQQSGPAEAPPPATEPTPPAETASDPPSAEEPPVTMEPEDPVTTEPPASTPADPPATCAPKTSQDGAEAATTCPEQGGSTPSPAATDPPVAQPTTAPPAAPPAPVVTVVTLAPAQAAAPADNTPAAALEGSTVIQQPVATLAGPPAIELARVAVPTVSIGDAKAPALAAVAGGVAGVSLVSTATLPRLPTVNGLIATTPLAQAARASPTDRDGHRAGTKTEERKPPSVVAAPSGPGGDGQGHSASGGSSGGSAPGAASLRNFAIATTPMRFNFPSAFAHAPLSSTVPTGALEDAPTTRPG